MDSGRQENEEDNQDVTRFWREEREEGAVYNAYLKKVTYRSQARLEFEAEAEFSHLMWETQKTRVIRAGTLEKLVESMATVRGELDSTFVNVFLATYRVFAQTQQVLALIIQRYNFLKSCQDEDKRELYEQQQKTIKSVLSVWLDTYPEDFREDPDYPCLMKLEQFASENLPDSDLALRARHRLDKFRREAMTQEKTPEFRFNICQEVDAMMDSELRRPLTFMDIPNTTFAQQLTYKDAELFRKVVPHMCLGAIWARRGRESESETACVQATIQQFNRVSLRVIATVLKTKDIRPSQRAKLLQKWIYIAQELRELKNFSSLKAIIASLQSQPIHRLRKTWAHVTRDAMILFEELAGIFSEENNQLSSRELLMKEATAKFPDLDSQNKTLKRKNLAKRQSWIDNGIVQGTVPYLGTFLTDLMMIDTAIPDRSEDGLINFEKHRKEFEVLAQIKLLQSAAQIYNISFDPNFWIWFDSVRVYSDSESHEMSKCLEPPPESATKLKKKSARCLRCKWRSHTCSLPSLLEGALGSLGHKPAKFEGVKAGLFACGVEGNRSSVSSIPDSLGSAPLPGTAMSHASSTSSVMSSDSDGCSPYRSPDTYVIRVRFEPSDQASTHIYKSIMLTNTDHTHMVLQKILEKYSVEGQPQDYCLFQLLPDGELLIPDRSNVFYALNNNVDFNFVVRSRAEYESSTLKKKHRRCFKKLSL